VFILNNEGIHRPNLRAVVAYVGSTDPGLAQFVSEVDRTVGLSSLQAKARKQSGFNE